METTEQAEEEDMELKARQEEEEEDEERQRQEEEEREHEEQRRLEEEERLRKEDPKHWQPIMFVFLAILSISNLLGA